MSDTFAPDGHPLVSGFRCPSCESDVIKLALEAEYALYLRCDRCAHTWSIAERRHPARRRRKPSDLSLKD